MGGQKRTHRLLPSAPSMFSLPSLFCSLLPHWVRASEEGHSPTAWSRFCILMNFHANKVASVLAASALRAPAAKVTSWSAAKTLHFCHSASRFMAGSPKVPPFAEKKDDYFGRTSKEEDAGHGWGGDWPTSPVSMQKTSRTTRVFGQQRNTHRCRTNILHVLLLLFFKPLIWDALMQNHKVYICI